MNKREPTYIVRQSEERDIPAIVDLCRNVYADSPPWTETQLLSHQGIFPQGQLVAVHRISGKVIGMAASLIVFWDDFSWDTPWRDFTDGGMFTNHDPLKGRTLYGAEIMIHPKVQGSGAGTLLYKARTNIARNLKLLRIRAGARLRGFHQYAKEMSAEKYVAKVVAGEIKDPTLSFQLKQGFKVLCVIEGYLRNDPESLGYAAVIEWINKEVATKV